MNNKRFLLRFSQERGEASFLEYSIVMPICMVTFFFIYMLGLYLNQAALLDSAAERGLLIAQKFYTDTNAEQVMSADALSGFSSAGFTPVDSPDYDKFENDPYRFLNKNYKSSSIEEQIEETVISIVRNGQLFGNVFLDEPEVEYTAGEGFLDHDVTVTVTQSFKPLRFVSAFFLKNKTAFTLQATSTLHINSQTEFIRNTDMVCDLLVRFGADQYISKVTGLFDSVIKYFGKQE